MSEQPTRSITIRIDADLLQAIRKSAAKNARSMNAEISERLATSLNQDALWAKDPGWLMRERLDRVRVSAKERAEHLRRELADIDHQKSILTMDLAKSPKSAQGLMIHRLAELEQNFSLKEAELRLIDPEYRGG